MSERHFGWHHRPEDVRAVLYELERTQPVMPYASIAASHLKRADDDRPVLLWKAEEKVKGGEQPSWDQGQVGTCVSFGWGRGTNDLLYGMVARGVSDKPPADVATEPIYGGSRVEVGGGRISGDGSVGAWAAKWVSGWGLLFRQPYLSGKWNLSKYSEQLSRHWGYYGVPDELEPVCKEHPVKTVALVQKASEAWSLLGNGYPIPICSGVGFDSPLVEGFCERSGSWGHCMLLRGRLIAKRRGKNLKAFVIQNSWADYLAGQGEPYVTDGDGKRVKLPQGCFCVDEATVDLILSEQDSFSISDAIGFEVRELDWYL